MKPSTWLLLAGLFGAAGVSLGAYGAHGLDTLLVRKYAPEDAETWKSAPVRESLTDAAQANQIFKRIDNFNTAVRYQMWHTLALVAVAVLATQVRSACLNLAGLFFLLGIVLFSGLLFAWSLGGPQWLVHVVPFGGVSFILGWLLLGFSGLRLTRSEAIGQS